MTSQPVLRERPTDDQHVSTLDALQWQIEYVTGANSPVAALVLAAVRDDLGQGGTLATVLPRDVRFGDLIGLRVMAAMHRLALERRAPHVAMHLPTLGGTPPTTPKAQELFRHAVVAALVQNQEALRGSLARIPQTNETGRAALLRCALSRLDSSAPVRLREVGASAGLNLRADHLPGDPALEAGPLPVIVERRGCDLNPVDPTTQDGRLTLSSYVWVDDVERFDRLSRALAVAARVPATVDVCEAGDFVEAVDTQEGHTTVLWHSAMWLYLPSQSRSRILSAAQAIGARATVSAPFVHASWEWAGQPLDVDHPFQLVVRQWRGRPGDGVPQVLAHGASHGAADLVNGLQGLSLGSEPLS